jgi:hypothetical protein
MTGEQRRDQEWVGRLPVDIRELDERLRTVLGRIDAFLAEAERDRLTQRKKVVAAFAAEFADRVERLNRLGPSSALDDANLWLSGLANELRQIDKQLVPATGGEPVVAAAAAETPDTGRSDGEPASAGTGGEAGEATGDKTGQGTPDDAGEPPTESAQPDSGGSPTDADDSPGDRDVASLHDAPPQRRVHVETATLPPRRAVDPHAETRRAPRDTTPSSASSRTRPVSGRSSSISGRTASIPPPSPERVAAFEKQLIELVREAEDLLTDAEKMSTHERRMVLRARVKILTGRGRLLQEVYDDVLGRHYRLAVEIRTFFGRLTRICEEYLNPYGIYIAELKKSTEREWGVYLHEAESELIAVQDEVRRRQKVDALTVDLEEVIVDPEHDGAWADAVRDAAGEILGVTGGVPDDRLVELVRGHSEVFATADARFAGLRDRLGVAEPADGGRRVPTATRNGKAPSIRDRFRNCFTDRTGVIIGGLREENRRTALARFLGFASLDWIEYTPPAHGTDAPEEAEMLATKVVDRGYRVCLVMRQHVDDAAAEAVEAACAELKGVYLPVTGRPVIGSVCTALHRREAAEAASKQAAEAAAKGETEAETDSGDAGEPVEVGAAAPPADAARGEGAEPAAESPAVGSESAVGEQPGDAVAESPPDGGDEPKPPAPDAGSAG